MEAMVMFLTGPARIGYPASFIVDFIVCPVSYQASASHTPHETQPSGEKTFFRYQQNTAKGLAMRARPPTSESSSGKNHWYQKHCRFQKNKARAAKGNRINTTTSSAVARQAALPTYCTAKGNSRRRDMPSRYDVICQQRCYDHQQPREATQDTLKRRAQPNKPALHRRRCRNHWRNIRVDTHLHLRRFVLDLPRKLRLRLRSAPSTRDLTPQTYANPSSRPQRHNLGKEERNSTDRY